MIKSKYTLEFPLSGGRLALLNTLHGSIDLLSEPAKRRWETVSDACEPDEDLKYYVDRGHVVGSGADDEDALVKAFEKHEASLSASASCYVFFPTFQCNLRCKYCFQHPSLKKTDDVMSSCMVDAALELIDSEQLNRNVKIPPTIGILGGEPLLSSYQERNPVENILRAAEARGWCVELVTNGTSLSEHVDHLAQYQKTLRSLQVSMDGPQEHNDHRKRYISRRGSPFEATMLGIAKALRAGLNVSIRLNVDHGNIDQVPDFVNSLSSHDAIFLTKTPPIYLGIVKTYGRNYKNCLDPTDAYTRLFSWLGKDDIPEGSVSLAGCTPLNNLSVSFSSSLPAPPLFSYCAANRDLFCFGPDGSIYPCVVAAGDSVASIGSYWPEKAIDKHALEAWRKHNIFTQAKCKRCPTALVCGGGCAYEALKHNGTMEEPYCEPIAKLLHIGLAHFAGEQAAGSQGQ